MGLMDAFGAECRVEITVRELIAILDEKAKAKAGFNVAMDMLREGVAPETVRAVFGFKPKEKEPTPAEAETSSKGNYTNNDTTKSAESQALESAKAKLLAIYETLTPEECRAWELGEVYAEVVRGCGE